MTRIDWELCVIAQAGNVIEPVQLQKALFLVGKLSARKLQCNDFYQFEPYDYGPFSTQIYFDAELLERRGLVLIQRPPATRYKMYSVTESGAERASQLIRDLPDDVKSFLSKVLAFVKNNSFDDVVTAIYKAYPEMAANSVFKQA